MGNLGNVYISGAPALCYEQHALRALLFATGVDFIFKLHNVYPFRNAAADKYGAGILWRED